MGESDTPPAEVAVVGDPYRPWWPVAMMAAGAGLLLSIGLTFTLVTSVQRADRAESDDRDAAAKIECRAAINAEITMREQRADNREHALLVEIVRMITTPQDQRDGGHLLEIADEIDQLNLSTTEAINDLQTYVEDESPLPCPFTH